MPYDWKQAHSNIKWKIIQADIILTLSCSRPMNNNTTYNLHE